MKVEGRRTVKLEGKLAKKTRICCVEEDTIEREEMTADRMEWKNMICCDEKVHIVKYTIFDVLVELSLYEKANKNNGAR